MLFFLLKKSEIESLVSKLPPVLYLNCAYTNFPLKPEERPQFFDAA
jgi:hypothetical protein